MNDVPSPHRSWLERLIHALSHEPQDRAELMELLRDAEQRKLLNADALTMIEGVLEVSEMQVRDIMVPRPQMVVVDYDDQPETLLPIIINSGHSRFPVIGETRDEVIGIMLAKDLLRFTFGKEKKPFNMQEILRPVVFVPESKRVDVLLREFRLNRYHIAIVVDEYGGIAGLVTIEDVLEEIVGDIEDEFDVEEDAEIKQTEEGVFTVKALTAIEDFNEYFDTHYSDEEFDTIGGLVMQHCGDMPQPGETIEIEPFQFKILSADNRRIELLQVKRQDTLEE